MDGLTPSKTDTFTYRSSGWKDQLTAYNGQTITYDEIGNPTSYRGMAMEWQKGRQLAKITKADGTVLNFAYNSEGNRVRKTVGGVTTQYYLNGGQIVGMKQGTDVMQFVYDPDGQPFMMRLNGADYYYILNGQGDVISLLDGSNTRVVEYQYDSWGKPTLISDTSTDGAGVKNPFRYRGYVWDEETELYYLGSRYYDAEVGRFLNADTFVVLGEDFRYLNLYLYCNNNPANYIDATGHFFEEIWEFARTAVGEIGKAIRQLEPVYTTSKNVAMSDGVLPVGDVIGALVAGIATAGAIATGIYSATKTKERSEAIASELGISITKQAQYNYWTADLGKNQIVGGEPLSVREASIRVAMGKSIMCRNQAAAQYILLVNGYWNAVGPERHRGGYLHYHPTRNHTGYASIHIWYFD